MPDILRHICTSGGTSPVWWALARWAVMGLAERLRYCSAEKGHTKFTARWIVQVQRRVPLDGGNGWEMKTTLRARLMLTVSQQQARAASIVYAAMYSLMLSHTVSQRGTRLRDSRRWYSVCCREGSFCLFTTTLNTVWGLVDALWHAGG